MKIRRDVSSVPFRTASDTWTALLGLITGNGSRDVPQLAAAAGVMGSVIADEHPKEQPLVLQGVGPQLRVYLLYGEDAITTGAALDSLAWNPTAGDWTLHVPCAPADLDWVRKSLARTSPRMQAYDVNADTWNETSSEPARKAADFTIDWNIKG